MYTVYATSPEGRYYYDVFERYIDAEEYLVLLKEQNYTGWIDVE